MGDRTGGLAVEVVVEGVAKEANQSSGAATGCEEVEFEVGAAIEKRSFSKSIKNSTIFNFDFLTKS